MRSDVSLAVILRVLERILINRENDSNSDLLWTSEKAFTNKSCDFFIDSSSGAPLTIIAENPEEITEEVVEMPLKPSLLARDPSRTEKVTTADLLQPTSLVNSNHENKIYGFYYLV